MRTIQEYLKECNRDNVIESFLYKYTFSGSLLWRNNKDLTINEIIEQERVALNGLIDRLIEIKPKKSDDGEVWILMTIHCAETDLGDDTANILVRQSDVMNEDLEWVTSYGYEFTPHEEAARFYVADTYLTQHYVEDLIVDYLYETSFTGYQQEGLKETLDRLNESIDDSKNNGTCETKDFSEFLEEDGYGFERKDPAQEKAWRDYIRHCIDYNKKCMEIEIGKLREMLKGK